MCCEDRLFCHLHNHVDTFNREDRQLGEHTAQAVFPKPFILSTPCNITCKSNVMCPICSPVFSQFSRVAHEAATSGTTDKAAVASSSSLQFCTAIVYNLHLVFTKNYCNGLYYHLFNASSLNEKLLWCWYFLWLLPDRLRCQLKTSVWSRNETEQSALALLLSNGVLQCLHSVTVLVFLKDASTSSFMCLQLKIPLNCPSQ